MPAHWNSPPNWPPPPVGWQPAPGWQPDPSWPAPPVGWNFWTHQPDVVPGYVTARPKRRLWLKIGLPLALLVATVLGVGGVVIVTKVHQTRRDAKNAAISYVTALQSHDFEAASAQLCDADLGYKAAFVKRWQTEFQNGSAIASFKVSSLTTVVSNGHQSGEVLISVVLANGVLAGMQLPLDETAGKWHPCPYP